MLSFRRFQRRQVGTALFLLTLASALHCNTSAGIAKGTLQMPGAEGVAITVTYLGASGFLIEAATPTGESSILTSPFFSNPDLGVVAAGLIAPDPDRIELGLRSVRDRLRNVSVVLVGHAHYDHLLDIPYIVNRHAVRAKVMGNRTAGMILSAPDPDCRPTSVTPALPCVDPGRFLDAETSAADAHHAGMPLCFSHDGPESCLTKKNHWRIRPIRSEHAPHLRPVKLYGGEVMRIPTRLPRRAEEWLEGQTLAYLVDFVAGGQIQFRIHFQDAVSTAPLGFPSDADLAERRIDAAVVCVPGYQEVDGYPETWIRKATPRTVILSHWESFFEPLPRNAKDLRPVPFNDPEGFLRRLKGIVPADRIVLPAPGTVISFGKKS